MISTASAPIVLRFWPYRTLIWLVTVPMTRKVDRKLINLLLFPMFRCTNSVIATILDWGKLPNRLSKYTEIYPTVISTDSAPCMPRFHTCCMLDWLVTVAGNNRVNRKPRNYQSVLDFFAMVKRSQNDRSFSPHLLTFLKTKEFQIKEKHLIIKPNIQND